MRTTRSKKALLLVFGSLVIEAAAFTAVSTYAPVSVDRRLDLFHEERLGDVPETALAQHDTPPATDGKY